ncbi:MAG: helix-turn-helix transcriptional regulator [Acholeplasmataceae bacterium]|nr:helix-turn-helix transcriptional regulator [Acholeplasmataceae bacterium]
MLCFYVVYYIIIPRGNIMNAKQIGNLVRNKRKELGITQAYLAAVANTGVRFISDLENGKPTVELEKTLHVLRVLNIKLGVIES